MLDLLRSPSFRWLIVVASLNLGSHATHDSFAMIAGNAAGVSPAAGSALWSESVAAEVIVFVAVGPFLLRHLTPESAMAISAVACVVRWDLLARSSSSTVPIAIAEPLHGVARWPNERTPGLSHRHCQASWAKREMQARWRRRRVLRCSRGISYWTLVAVVGDSMDWIGGAIVF